MSGFVGGCLAFVGTVRMVQVISECDKYLKWHVQDINQENDTKTKQIARIVANVLHIIGVFASALAMIAMGATLYSLAPGAVFLTGLTQAVNVALPYLVGSLGTMSAGLIIHHAAR